MTIITTIARFAALPIVAAGIAGGAALGLAGAAGATTTTTTTTGPTSTVSTINGNFNAPTTYATRAYDPQPGVQAWRTYHRG
jgi:hypothetical protein